MLIVSCALIYDDAIRECAVSTCVDPPIHLLAKIQATLIFFGGGGGGGKLHWVPQSMLFLPKEEGGQGLIHLQSRIAALVCCCICDFT